MLDRDVPTPATPPEPLRSRRGIAVAEVRSPLLRKGLALWEGQKGARRFPGRAEMSPRLLSGLLRNTVLVKVLDSGAEFEFRIVGDAIVAAQGASLQGMTTAQIDVALPGYGRMLGRAYREVYEAGAPRAYRGWFERGTDGRAFFQETLILPLGADGQPADHLLILAVYAYSEEQALG
jgi:hypothetical protein